MPNSDSSVDDRDPASWHPERFAWHLLQGAGEGITVYDRDLRYRVWNRFMEERTGRSSAETLGRLAVEVFPVMAESGTLGFLQRALAGEVVTTPDLSFDTPSGGKGWYVGRYQPYRDDEGRIIGVIGHFHDTTERRAGEDRLRRSEARLRAIVEGGSDLVVLLDGAGIATYVSPAISTMLGIDPADFVGKNPLARVHPDDRARVLAGFAAVRRTPELPIRVQYRTRHADGGWRMLLTTAKCLLDDPAVQGIVTSSRDVTEWQELQERLHQSQKIEAVGRLAGGVAHDFNNLLTVISGNARMLLADEDEASSWDERRGELEEIAQAAGRAATLTRQLLAFSRQQVLQPRVLDLNEVVTGMWALLDRLGGDGVAAAKRLQEPLGAVMADPVQVEQVLLNLVVNARDAMPDGGSLVIETANERVDEAGARRHLPMPPGDYVTLAVHDTGTGMDPKTLARAFEPFFTTKALGQGTGMGLSTVYGIVKQSGGYIWADSAPGTGTSFRIYLPRTASPAAVATRPVDAAAPSLSAAPASGTIVVVEDEPLVRAVTRRTLERAGYRVHDAADGAEALRLVRALDVVPDLVITDIVMPVMGGRELAATLGRELPGLRVLFMSGYTHERQAHLGDESGVSRFLHKPFSLDELRQRVRSLLEERPVFA